MVFTEKEQLLANEAHLTKAMLVSGLNSLRRANITLKGEYYQAFFSLSIGFERMLKIIYIRKYQAEHDGGFPSGGELKKLSHNLVELWSYIGMHKLEGIYKDILEFLDSFAGYARYYNLDIIMDKNGKNKEHGDVLENWARIQKNILKASGKECCLSTNQLNLAKIMDGVCVTLMNNLEGQELTSFSELMEEEINIDIIQGYSVQYIFEIIKTMYYKIDKIEKVDYRMPVLTEFFDFFTDYWKPYQIRNKKNWLNIK